MIDSGWDRTLRDLHILPGVGWADPEDELAVRRTDDDHDRIGHGTAVADLVLRLAPGAEIVPIRVFGAHLQTSPATIQSAIRWAAEAGIPLVNLSLGTLQAEAFRPLYATCEVARRKGTLVVSASHNGHGWSYPAAFDNVISVGADAFDSPFTFRYVPGAAVECIAHGRGVPVLWRGGEERVVGGNSFAAPHVTGIVALLLERYPQATLEEVRELLGRYAAG